MHFPLSIFKETPFPFLIIDAPIQGLNFFYLLHLFNWEMKYEQALTETRWIHNVIDFKLILVIAHLEIFYCSLNFHNIYIQLCDLILWTCDSWFKKLGSNLYSHNKTTCFFFRSSQYFLFSILFIYIIIHELNWYLILTLIFFFLNISDAQRWFSEGKDYPSHSKYDDSCYLPKCRKLKLHNVW